MKPIFPINLMLNDKIQKKIQCKINTKKRSQLGLTRQTHEA
jgi:hypothetical protein